MESISQILAFQSWSPAIHINIILAGHDLYGVPFVFLLKFLGLLILVFLGSYIISKLLGLDKAYDDLHKYRKV